MPGKRSSVCNRLFVGALFVVLGSATAGCLRTEYTCVSCHTDRETLEAVADPVNYPTSGGEG
jgi:nitrate/TMAO reductase-like tetraheme cytochrome c subunit